MMLIAACEHGNGDNTNAQRNTDLSSTNADTSISSDITEPTPALPLVEVSVSDETQLREAVATAGDTPTVITLTADIELISDFIIPGGANIWLKSRDESTFRLVATRNMPVIQVSSGATLTIDGIAVTRNAGTQGQGVRNLFGTFIMNSGEISGNHAAREDGASPGGVGNSGTFIMNGGRITGNQGNGTTTIVAGGVGNSGTFDMYNGTISGNTDAGVRNEGSFTMYGGVISENLTGVVNNRGGNFTMDEGIINNNSSRGVNNFSKFTLNGGRISGNTSPHGGGGGVFSSDIFTMNGGWVFDNIAGSDPDLFLDSTATFNNNVFDANVGAIGTGPTS